MKASELRIENLVYGLNDGNHSIKTVEKIAVLTLAGWETISGKQGIKPIPLTEEWLLKLPRELKYPDWIKAVHELQNWYYWNNNKKELEFTK